VFRFLGNHESLDGFMPAAADFHGRVAERAGEHMDALEHLLVEPEDEVRPEPKWPLCIFDVVANNVERNKILAHAIFSFALAPSPAYL
jgi:hypothetical protein